MPYNEYGDEIDEQYEIDKTFQLLAEEQELDEDVLRDSPKITRLVKDVVLDTGATWDDLVEACDEKFGTLEERVEELERERAFIERLQERLKNED